MRRLHRLILFIASFALVGVPWTAPAAESAATSLRRASLREDAFRSGYYFYQQQNFAASISFLDKAIAADPMDYRSRIWFGQAYFMAGFLKNALIEWQTALNLGEGGNLLRSKLNNLYWLQGKDDSVALSTPYLFLRSLSGWQQNKAHFTRASGVAVDGANRVFVAGFHSGSVAVMDGNGKITGTLTAGLKNPFDVALAPDGGLWVSDFGNDVVVRYDKNLRRTGQAGGKGFRAGQLLGPEGITVDRHGNLFVADLGNNRVQKFSADGKFLLELGSKGSDDGEFFRPADVAVAADGRIWVSDCGNRRLQVFDESGNFLQVLGADKLEEPRGLAFLDDGRLLVADGARGAVVYDPRDGSWNRVESAAGKVNRAVGAAADRNGMFYLADFDAFQVAVFVPERLKYVNLDVRLTRTLEFEFPEVQQFVTVRDRDGRPVTGLSADNFRVYERGVRIQPINLGPTWREKDKLAVTFLVEKTEAMKAHQGTLERVARAVLEKLSGADKVEVINFNQRAWIAKKFVSNVLSPLEGMRQGEYGETAAIGQAFYKGIGECFTWPFYRPAVVIFTTGELEEDWWAPYGYQTCLAYARHNGIPVYVVLFGRGQETARLERMAQETGGKVFDALSSDAVYKFREHVFERPLTHYALYYRTVAHERLRGSWREFTVEVNYKGLFGYDKSGYYIPK